jgi:signal transduction histidine kinase
MHLTLTATAVSGMIGISELLLSDRELQPKQRELVHKQLQAGEMLLQLVSMVLDIGKMEANKLEIEKAPFYLKDLLNSLEIFASLAAAKNIHFTRNILSPSDTYLVGDKLRLAQILSNFISK